MVNYVVTALVGALLLGIKWVGYGLAARRAGAAWYPSARVSPWKVAAVRVALGLAGTALLAALTFAVQVATGAESPWPGLVVGVGGQIALRAALWAFVVRQFYDPALADRAALRRAVVGGVVLSYVLDAPNYLLATANLLFLLRDVNIC